MQPLLKLPPYVITRPQDTQPAKTLANAYDLQEAHEMMNTSALPPTENLYGY